MSDEAPPDPSTVTGKRPAPRTAFGKVGGNKPGRRKKTEEQKQAEEMLREKSPRAVQKLDELVNGDDDALACKAAIAILQFTVGELKRHEQVNRPFEHLTDEQLDAEIAEIEREMATTH